METSPYFNIPTDKFRAVCDYLHANGCGSATDEQIRSTLLADYAEGEEHQQFLDEAPTREIGEWAWSSVRAACDEAAIDAIE